MKREVFAICLGAAILLGSVSLPQGIPQLLCRVAAVVAFSAAYAAWVTRPVPVTCSSRRRAIIEQAARYREDVDA